MPLSRIVALPFLLALLVPALADAAAYRPTRFDDPAPNGCQVDDCSLREAVLASAADVDYDAIELDAGTYRVGAPALGLAGGVRLYGAETGTTTIEGDGADTLFTYSGTRQMSMQDLTLDGGGAPELIVTEASDTIGLLHVRAPNPQGRIDIDGGDADGGGLGIDGSELVAPVYCAQVEYCLYSSSTFTYIEKRGSALFGGGATEVTLENVVIDGALAQERSGVDIDSSSLVTIVDTTIRNTAYGLVLSGAAFSDGADVDIARLRFIENARPVRVGIRRNVAIADSEFRDNRNDDVDVARPGALSIYSGTASVTIDRSAFVGNRGSADAGGAVLVEDGATLALRNSTFAGNTISAGVAGQPGGARGGAIGFRGDDETTTIKLQQVTIVAADAQPVGLFGSAIGGYGDGDGVSIAIVDTIVRGSCALDADMILIAAGNIESGGDTCHFATDDHNLIGVAAAALALGPLALHGGRTPSFEPGTGSVAIDAAFAPYCLNTDQRGYARPFGAGCDIGSVEAGDVIFADGLE